MKNALNHMTRIVKRHSAPIVASAVLAVATAATPMTVSAQVGHPAATSQQLSKANSAVSPDSRPTRDELAKLSALPPAAQSYISGSLGASLPSYRIEDRADGFHATSRGLASDFTGQYVQISHDSAQLRLALEAYGHGHSLNTVKSTSATRVSPNRVEYHHQGLTEWYVNGPLGLEQGFTVDRAEKTSSGPLTVALALDGNVSASLGEGGTAVRLSDRQGKNQFEYSGLVSTDADGKELPSRLEVAGSRLLIRVDDSTARYPVTIDPWVNYTITSAFTSFVPGDDAGASVSVDVSTSSNDYVVVVGARGAVQPTSIGGNGLATGVAYVFESQNCCTSPTWTTFTLFPSDGVTGDFFGQSVSIDNNPYSSWNGQTIAVGAWNHNSGTGKTYVFVKPGSWWTNSSETAQLTNSAGLPGFEFGFAVSVSSNMVVVGEPQPYACAGCGAGAAYVYETTGPWVTTSTPSGVLTTPSLPNGSEFGFSVSINGAGGYDHPGVAMVGAPQLPGFGGCNCGPGYAYIYQEPTGGWAGPAATIATLSSPYSTNDWFGFSVSMALGDWAVVGAPNATCVYKQLPVNIQVCPKNLPAKTGLAYQFSGLAGWANTNAPNVIMYPSDGRTGDLFGISVAADGKASPSVVVGAPFHSNGNRKGKGYFFEGNWWKVWPFAEHEKQSVSPAGSNSEFGWSASVFQVGPAAAVFGAPEKGSYAGGAYFYYKP
jgi:hypothetical protein